MKKFIIGIVLSILSIVVGFSGGFAFNFIISAPESETFISGDISFHFLELGTAHSGDSIFIQCGETDILIDAGARNSSSSTIINYVDNFVSDNKLEFVIATHSDQDHISAFYSGANNEGVFAHYDTDIIIDFPKTNKTDPTDNSVLGKYYLARDEEVANGAKHFTALECYNEQNGAQKIYEISNGVTMEILYNYYYENSSSDENEYSVCLMFNQGDNHYLFTGDLEKDGEAKLIEFYQSQNNPLPKCNLYKAGHHGSKTSSSPEFLAVIQPEICVVTTFAGSDEFTETKENQFPTQTFINNISLYTDQVYVTSVVDYEEVDGVKKEILSSLNGNIVLTFSSSGLKKEFSGSDKVLKESQWFKDNRTIPANWA